MFLDGAKLICLNDVAAGDVPQQGETVLAQGKTFKFGYYMDCDVVLENPNALGLQCTIDCDAFGRVTIENLCPEEPITLDGKVLKKTRPLLHNTEIGIFDKKYLWQFEGSDQSAAFQMEDAADYTTPCKQMKKAEQPPHSEPARRWRTQFQKRLTIHNLVHYHIKPGESPQDVETITDENKPLNSFERIIDAESPIEPSKRLSPAPQQVAADLIELKTPKVRQRSLVARKTPLSSCKLSETVITSYSPRETGVRPEKSFAIVQSLTVTPAKTSTTLPDMTLGPFQQSSSPSLTQNHRSSMHLIDLTTPMKRIPSPSPLLLKSTLKKNATVTKQQPVSLTPAANSSSSSVFSVHSTDDESVIELSDDGGFSSSPVLKTPTRLKTPQSLMKRAILGSAKKAAIIKRLQQPGPGPAPPPDLTTPKTPAASASKVRFQSRSTPPRKSLCGRLQSTGQSVKASQSVLGKVGKSMVTSTPFRARTSTSTGFRRSSIVPSPSTDPRSKSRTSLMLKHALSGSPHSSVILKRKSLALLTTRKSLSKVNQADPMLEKSETRNEDEAPTSVNDTTFSPEKERKEDAGVGVPTITISDIDPDPTTDEHQNIGIPTITISDVESEHVLKPTLSTPAASNPEGKANATSALKKPDDAVEQSTSKHQLNVTFSPEKRQADKPDFPQTPQSSRSFSKTNAEKAYASPDLRANMDLMDDDDFEGLDAIFKTPKARNLMILSSPKSISLQKPSSDSVELIQSTEYDLSPSLDDIFQTPQSELMNNRTEGGTTPADAEALGPYSSEEAFDMMVGRPINKRSYARKPTPRKEELTPLKVPRDESLPKTDIEEWIDNVNESIETLDGEKEEEDEMSYLTANQSELSRDPLMTSSITASVQRTKQKKAFKAPNDESAMTIQEDDEEECGENASALKDPLEMTVPSPKKTVSPNISGIDLLDHTSESFFSETLAVSDESSGKDGEKAIEQPTNDESTVCVEEDLAISPDKARQELEQAFENFEKEHKAVEGKRLISTPEPKKPISKLASRRTVGNEPTLSAVFDLNALKEEREMEMAFEKFEEKPAFSEQRLAQTPEPKKVPVKDQRRTMGSGALTGVKLDLEAAKAEHEMRMAFENFEEEPEFTGERAAQTPEPKKELSKDHRRTVGSALVKEVTLDLEAAKAQREMELAFENFKEEPEFTTERTVQTPEPKKPLSKDHRRTMGSSLVSEVKLDLQAAKAQRELEMAFENFKEEPEFTQERAARTPEPNKQLSKDHRRTMGSKLVTEVKLDLEAAKAERDMELAFENFEEEPEFAEERAAQTPEPKKAAIKDHRRTMGSSLVTEVKLNLAEAKAQREMELAFQNFEEEPDFNTERVAKTPEPKKEPLKDHRRTLGSSLVSKVTLDLEAIKEQREMELAFENFEEEPEFTQERAAKTPEPKKQLSKDHRRTLGSSLISEVMLDLEAAKAERDMELAFENFEEEPEFTQERAARTPEPKKQLSKDHRRTMGSKLVTEVKLDLEAAKAERDLELAFENFEEEPDFTQERAARTPEPKKQLSKDHRRTMGSKLVTEVKLDLEAAKAERDMELAFENFEEEPEFTQERAARTPEPKKLLSKDHRRTMGSKLVTEVKLDLEAAKAERDMELAFENFEEEPEFTQERAARTPEPKKQFSKDHRRTMGSNLVTEVKLDLEAAKAERDMELAFENFEEEPEFTQERAARTPEPKKQLPKDHRRTLGSGLISEVTLDLEAAKAERDMELAFENFEEEPEFTQERAAKTPEPKKQLSKDHRRTMGAKLVTEVKLDLEAAKAQREMELAFENFEDEPEFIAEREVQTPEPKKLSQPDHRRTMGTSFIPENKLDVKTAKIEHELDQIFGNFVDEPTVGVERLAKTPDPRKTEQTRRMSMGYEALDVLKGSLEPFSLTFKLKNESGDHLSDEDTKNKVGEKHLDEAFGSRNVTDAQTLLVNTTNGAKQPARQKNDENTAMTPSKTLRRRRQNSIEDLEPADDNKNDDKKNGGSASHTLRKRRNNSASDDEATKSIRIDSTDVDSTEDEAKLSTTGRRKRLRKKGVMAAVAETIGEVQHPLEPIAEEERRQSTQLLEQEPENKGALQVEAPAKSVLSLKADVDEVICSSPSSSLSHTRGRRVQLSVVLKQSNDVTSTTSETDKVGAAEGNVEATQHEAEVRISDETFAEEIDLQTETIDAEEEIPSTPAPTKVRSRRPSRRAVSTDTAAAPVALRRGGTQQDTGAKAEEKVEQKAEVMAVQSDQAGSNQLEANMHAEDRVCSAPVPSEAPNTPAVHRGRRGSVQQDTPTGVEKVIFSTAAPRRDRRGSVQQDLDEAISQPLPAEVEAAPAARRGRKGSVQQDSDAANDVDPSLPPSESARALPIRRGRRGSAQQEVSTPVPSESTTVSTVRRGRRGSFQPDDAEDVVLSTPLPKVLNITRRGRLGSAQQDTTIEADIIASTPSRLNTGSAVRRGRRASVQEDLILDAEEVIPSTPLPSEHTAASAVRRGRRGSAKQDTEAGAEKIIYTTPLQSGLSSTPSRRRNRRGSAQNDTESDGDDSVFSTALPSGKLDLKALQIEAIAENSDEAEEEIPPTPKVKPEIMKTAAKSEQATAQETCETNIELPESSVESSTAVHIESNGAETDQAKLEKQEVAPAKEGLTQEQSLHTTLAETSVQNSLESTEPSKKADSTEHDTESAEAPVKSDEAPRTDNEHETTSTSENLLDESTTNPSIQKEAEKEDPADDISLNLVEHGTEQTKIAEAPSASNDIEEINLEQTISNEAKHRAEGRAMMAKEVEIDSSTNNAASDDAGRTEDTSKNLVQNDSAQEEPIDSSSLEMVEPSTESVAPNAAETSEAPNTAREAHRAVQKAGQMKIAEDLIEALAATNDGKEITLEQEASNETEDLVEGETKNDDEVEAVSSEKDAASDGPTHRAQDALIEVATVGDVNEITPASETLVSQSVAEPSAEEEVKKEVQAEIAETIEDVVSVPQKTRGRKVRLASDGSKSGEALSKTRGRRAASRSESTESVEEPKKLNTRTKVSEEASVSSETLELGSIEESPKQEETEQDVQTPTVKATDVAQVDVAKEPSKAESTEKDSAEVLVAAGNGHDTIPTTETLNETDDKVVSIVQKTRGRKRRNTATSADGSTSDAAESTEIPTKSRGRRAALNAEIIAEVSEVITEHETLAENSPEELGIQENVEPETQQVIDEPVAGDENGTIVAPEVAVEKPLAESQSQEDVEDKPDESVSLPQKSRGRKRKASAAETLVPDIVELVEVPLESRGRKAGSKLLPSEKDEETVVDHPPKDVDSPPNENMDTDSMQEKHEASPSESVDTSEASHATSNARQRKPALKTKLADPVDESSAPSVDESTTQDANEVDKNAPEVEVASKTDAELSAPLQRGRGRRAKNLEQSSTQESKPAAVTARSRGRGKHQESEPTATEDLHIEQAAAEALPVIKPTDVSSAEDGAKHSSEAEKTDDDVIVPSVPVVPTKSRGRKPKVVETSAVGLTPDTEVSTKTRGRRAPVELVAEQSDVEQVAKVEEKVVQPRKRRGRAGVSVDERAEAAAGGDEKVVQTTRRRGRAASRTEASESVDVTKDDHQEAHDAAPTTKDSSSGADAEEDVPSAQVPATKQRGRRGAAKLDATESTVTAAPRRNRRGTVDHEIAVEHADESEAVLTNEHDRLVAIKSETGESLKSSTPIPKRGRRGAVEEFLQVTKEVEPKKRRGRAASKSEATEPVSATKESSDHDADSEDVAPATKRGRPAVAKIEPAESTVESSATRGRRGAAKQPHDTGASHADTEEAPPPKKRGRQATVKQELVQSEIESSHDHDHDADVEDEEAPSKTRGRVAAAKKEATETSTPSLKRGRRGIVRDETPQTGTTEAPRGRGGRQAKAKVEHANETSTPVTKRAKKPDSTNEESKSQEQSIKEELSTSTSKDESEQSTEPEKKLTRGRRAMSTSSPPKEDTEKCQKKPVRGRRAQTAQKDTTIESTSHTEEEQPAAKPTRGRKQPAAKPDTSSEQEPAQAVVTKSRGRGRAKAIEVEEPKAPTDEETDNKPTDTEQPNKKTTRGRRAAQPKSEAESTPQVKRVRKAAASTAPKDSDDEQPETSKRSARSKETSEDTTKEEKLRKPTRANRRHLEIAAEDSDLDTPSKRVRRKAKILLSDEFVT